MTEEERYLRFIIVLLNDEIFYNSKWDNTIVRSLLTRALNYEPLSYYRLDLLRKATGEQDPKPPLIGIKQVA